jgi:ribosomal-protein-alanine N-acetyltransferase
VARTIVSGERVTLVRPRMGDRNEFLVAVARSASLLQPWVYAPSTPVQWSAYVRRMRAPDARAFHLRRRGDGALVGVVNLNTIILGGLRQAFVGYYAFLPYAGLGYMTEGLSLVVDQAFGEVGLHRLEANIQPGNEPSKALAARLGFRCEGFSPRYLQVGGVWRDHERWAITAEDRLATS